MITDKLKSYGAAKREIIPGVEHRQHKGLNNQLPPANPPTRTTDEAVQVGPPRSALRLDPLANLSPFPATNSPPPTTAPPAPKPSRTGPRSPAPAWPPDHSPDLRSRHHTAPWQSNAQQV